MKLALIEGEERSGRSAAVDAPADGEVSHLLQMKLPY